jgi:hypothetical protein
MENQSRYTLNLRLRNLYYQADGYTKSAIELHCHDFESFDESFAFLLSLDEKYFNERIAVNMRSAIVIESADINDTSQPVSDEPTIVTAMKGGDSPLINEPPGLYYIMWQGVGNFSRDYGIVLDGFVNCDLTSLLLPVARLNAPGLQMDTDPAFDRLKHRYLQQYLTEKKYCLSTLSIASHLDISGERNFTGRLIDAWHFNSLPQALTAFASWDMQLLDAGYCSVKGINRYYEGLRLYEERGDDILMLSTNIYLSDIPANIARGVYLHCNENNAFGRWIGRRLHADRKNSGAYLVATYENGYQYTGPTNTWLQFQSAAVKLSDKTGVTKRRSFSAASAHANTKTRIKP